MMTNVELAYRNNHLRELVANLNDAKLFELSVWLEVNKPYIGLDEDACNDIYSIISQQHEINRGTDKEMTVAEVFDRLLGR